jgi:Na+/phosphate symporter
MLPDYPKVKSLLNDAFQKRINIATQRRLGVFSQIKQTQMHEGSVLHLTRNDGSSENVEMKPIHASAEIKHDIREIDKLDFDEIIRMADTLGERLADEQQKMFLERFDNAVREVGNVSDPSKSFIEQLFDSWEKVDIDFSPDGKPEMPQLIFGSEKTMEKAKEALQQIESDPVLRKRRNDIFERKMEEWRDRETARNLVE